MLKSMELDKKYISKIIVLDSVIDEVATLSLDDLNNQEDILEDNSFFDKEDITD